MSWNDTGESLHDRLLEMGVCRREGGVKYPRILWGRLDPIVTCQIAPIGPADRPSGPVLMGLCLHLCTNDDGENLSGGKIEEAQLDPKCALEMHPVVFA